MTSEGTGSEEVSGVLVSEEAGREDSGWLSWEESGADGVSGVDSDSASEDP